MTNFEDFCLSGSFLGGTSKLAIHRRLDGISKVQKADWNPNSKTYGLPDGFLGPERRRYVPDPFEGKGSRKLVPDFHIEDFRLVWISTWFSASRAAFRRSKTPKEISSNLDTGIPQGNRLQFGYRNPARKSAPICHPTGNILIFWELRNLTYTGFPDAWKFSKVILNSYFTFQVFRQLEY
ncbi:unnamed protein product [Rhizophagus irregularis]|nr:unnamed protein product [Rhizophagus irregularis]